jgi:hypothetical protein
VYVEAVAQQPTGQWLHHHFLQLKKASPQRCGAFLASSVDMPHVLWRGRTAPQMQIMHMRFLCMKKSKQFVQI